MIFQKYIESLSLAEAEDSSYDSDGDLEDTHTQVSRTTSDTLGQEFAEYVTQPIQGQVHNGSLIFYSSFLVTKFIFACRIVRPATHNALNSH